MAIFNWVSVSPIDLVSNLTAGGNARVFSNAISLLLGLEAGRMYLRVENRLFILLSGR